MNQQSKKVLVVYFSRTGHTKHIVDNISKMINCDVERLKPKTNFNGFWGSVKGVLYSFMGKGCKIEPVSQSIENYDAVIICSPIWAGKLSAPAREFFYHKKGFLNKYAIAISSSSGDIDGALKEAEYISGQKPLSRISILDKDRVGGRDYGKIGRFVEQLKFKLQWSKKEDQK